MKRALLAVLAGVLLLPLTSDRISAQGTSPLKFFANYFITGDYAVGGASLWRKGEGGIATASIAVGGVPQGVDIVGAFLYVQTAEHVQAQWSGILGARFNGTSLDGPLVAGQPTSIAKALNWEQATRPCWSVAIPGGRRLVTYRADVLRFLPVVDPATLPGDPKYPYRGKFDLTGPLQVKVPDWGTSFGDDDELGIESSTLTAPRAVGASLVVVYKDSSTAPQQLRGVVIYDGGFTKTAFASMSQTMAGFYQTAATPGAKLTAIVGDGRPFLSERLRVNGANVATNPFTSSAGPKWDNPTFPLSSAIVGPNAEAAAVEILPNGLLSDCVSTSALIMSVNVADVDDDGLVDRWETGTASAPVLDADGQHLPYLRSMGATVGVRDLFIEVGAMYTTADTAYAGTIKPQHSHLPDPQVIKKLGDTLIAAPNGNPIAVHVDVSSDPGYDPTGIASPYVIPAAFSRVHATEAIDERYTGIASFDGLVPGPGITVCDRAPGEPEYVCQFNQSPGTVGWKSGFRFLRDEYINRNGIAEPAPGADDPCDLPGSGCRRRFDHNRQQMFHYALFAHAVGLPKEDEPCRTPAGDPIDGVNGVCIAPNVPNPEFHNARTNTGVGDFPGGDFMVTLGGFDDELGRPIGTTFMQASTMLHELGHNIELRHGGGALEPNCKPNYFSVMNYLYQLRGLLDDGGDKHMTFSAVGPLVNPLNEASLPAVESAHPLFRLGWFAPLPSSYLDDQYVPVGPAALPTRYCNGAELPTTPPLSRNQLSVRVDAAKAAPTPPVTIDWLADGDGNAASPAVTVQDLNFDGDAADVLTSFDDWSALRLNQVGARRNIGIVTTIGSLDIVGPLSVILGKGDLGKGDLGKGDLGKGDLGKGDLGKGDLGKGDLGKGDLGKGDLGKGDLGKGDLGGGDLFDPIGVVGAPPGGELDLETFISMGSNPPYEVAYCVGGTCETVPEGVVLSANDILLTWTPAGAGVESYDVYRALGNLIPDETNWGSPLNDGALGAGTLYFEDNNALLLPAGTYTYWVVANYANAASAPSNPVSITVVNDPPVAENDTYTTNEDTALVAGGVENPNPGVLANDDDDHGATLLAQVVLPPSHGTLELSPNGWFTYTPAANYNGPDSFQYRACEGSCDGGVLSNVATVSITVSPVNDPPSGTTDGFSTNEDTALLITQAQVLANDSDVDGTDTLSAFLCSPPLTGCVAPAHGTVTFGEGGFLYTPAPGYSGSDGFTYRVFDGVAYSAAIAVTITVNPVNDPPAAYPQMVSTNEDTAKAIVLTGSDPEGSALTFAIVTPPTNGALSGTAPNLTYTPNANFNGSDAFTFKVNDGGLDSPAATVGITVNPVNDAPRVVNDTYTMVQGGTLNIAAPGVLGNDSDVEGSALTAILVTTPPNCTLQFNANGSFTFIPAASFTGVVTFKYKAKEVTAVPAGSLLSSADATVTITVTPAPYSGIYNVENLPPPAGVKFSRTGSVTFRWNFLRTQVVASSDALPSVTVLGPNGFSKTFTPASCGQQSQFCSAFTYYSSIKKWLFTWKPAGAAAGDYYVYVGSGLTNQTFPAAPAAPPVNGYKVVLKP